VRARERENPTTRKDIPSGKANPCDETRDMLSRRRERVARIYARASDKLARVLCVRSRVAMNAHFGGGYGDDYAKESALARMQHAETRARW